MIISLEQAKAEGTKPASLRHIAQWHKNQASLKRGTEKEGHFKIAAELMRLAEKLEKS